MRQGYATKSVEMIENLLFADNSVRGIKLLNQFSTSGATSRIAVKLGFEMSKDDAMTFVKHNPNYVEKPENEVRF